MRDPGARPLPLQDIEPYWSNASCATTHTEKRPLRQADSQCNGDGENWTFVSPAPCYGTQKPTSGWGNAYIQCVYLQRALNGTPMTTDAADFHWPADRRSNDAFEFVRKNAYRAVKKVGQAEPTQIRSGRHVRRPCQCRSAPRLLHDWSRIRLHMFLTVWSLNQPGALPTA